MILPTMSHKEIASEIDKDLIQLYAYINRVLDDRKYYRASLNYKSQHFFKTIFWTSSRKNRYYILPYTNGKSDMKKFGLCFIVHCYYNDEKNRLNCVMIGNNWKYTFISGHLIERYVQRFLHKDNMNKLDAMIEYSKNNSIMCNIPFTTSKYNNSIIARVKDGVVIGDTIDGYTSLNTFITLDMLQGSEFDFVSESKEALDIGEKRRLTKDSLYAGQYERFCKCLKLAS